MSLSPQPVTVLQTPVETVRTLEEELFFPWSEDFGPDHDFGPDPFIDDTIIASTTPVAPPSITRRHRRTVKGAGY